LYESKNKIITRGSNQSFSQAHALKIKIDVLIIIVIHFSWSQSDAPVKKLDRADKNQQHIENWIKNIKVTFNQYNIMYRLVLNVKELRRSRPPDRVAYSRQMPDLEKLMQEWPPEIDALFQSFAVISSFFK
jgi:intraflagellar transport protein 46